MRRRLLLACLVTTAALAGGGCRVDVGLDLEVEGDGTGTVDVVVALDEAAARRVPDLADQLEVDDLVASGWDITGPDPVDGGGVEVRATKPFASLAELDRVIDEVSGEEGPLADLTVSSERSTFSDRWELRGVADLRAGLEAFGDDALRARLGGTSLGTSEAELEEAAGRPLAEAVRFSVDADLPGGGGSFAPRLGETVELSATSRSWHLPRVVLAVLAVAAVAGAVLVLARGAGGARGDRRVPST